MQSTATNFLIPQKPNFRLEDCNCLNDVLFKHLFGRPEHKALTIDLLNTFLAEGLGHEIVDLTFEPQETVPNREDGKETRFDVACTLDSGEMVDIEVQMLDPQNMRQRTLYYWADMYYRRLAKGDNYSKLVPTITFNILNFVMFEDDPDPFSSWAICNLKTHKPFLKDLSLNFLEIPKFAKQLKSDKPLTKAERWMCYFSSKLTMSEKWKALQGDDVMTQAMAVANEFFNNPAEYRRYRDREMIRRDRVSEQEGLLAKGIGIGEERERESLVLNVLKNIPNLKSVATLMNVSLAEVQRIAAKYGIHA